jgi:hypothetical protein
MFDVQLPYPNIFCPEGGSTRKSAPHLASMYFATGVAEVKMAKYGKSASKTVKSAMHRKKKGTLKSGSGRKVTSRKQAIAIGLSEARKKGAKVPRKSSRKSSKKK